MEQRINNIVRERKRRKGSQKQRKKRPIEQNEQLTEQEAFEQVALLWQRDCTTRLSVEILQLQNIAIVWHYLRDPTFSRFYTIPSCNRHTQTDGRTDTRRRNVLRLA